MKHTINGYIVHRTARYWRDSERVTFQDYEPSENSGDIVVSKTSIEVEVPDDFDPRPAQVEILRRQKEEVRAKFAAAVMEFDRRINELLAIEHSTETVEG